LAHFHLLALLLVLSRAWASWYPSISLVPQALAACLLGIGIALIFVQALNYLLDSYLMHANSAIAANAFYEIFL
jgi:MFS transporter, DHA1 family, multidrug resistance protein